MDIIVRIFSYLKPYWKQVILLYGSLVLALSLQLLTPYVLGRAIDDGVIARDTSFLLKAAGLGAAPFALSAKTFADFSDQIAAVTTPTIQSR